jgi:hypothetical protein
MRPTKPLEGSPHDEEPSSNILKGKILIKSKNIKVKP